MKFKDIKKFTRIGHYETTCELNIFDWRIETYIERGLILNPDFQRGHIWNENQQIKFIEFLLRGGNSGRIIYLNHPGWQRDYKGDFVVVDGLQRITAILKFLDNEIKVFNHYYKDFEDKIPLDNNMIINVNNLRTKQEVLEWYVELNEGGTPHTKQEIDRVKEMLEEIKKGDQNERKN